MKKYFFAVYALALAALLVPLCGCSLATQNFFSDSDAYTAGNTAISDPVESLDIAWLAGEVRVERGDGPDILLSETSDVTLTEKMQLHWWLDGRTLRVKFASAGAREETENRVEKQLTVTLPRELSLNRFEVHIYSAGLTGDVGAADEVNIRATSGSTDITCKTPELRVNSMSGAVVADNSEEAPHTIDIRTTSGRVELSCRRVSGTAYVKTTSGSIAVSADAAEEMTLESDSGRVSCHFASAGANNGTFRTTSGSILLSLPADFGFTLHPSAGSGSLNGTDFGFSDGSDTYVYGDGAATLSVKTGSGSITLQQN